MNDAEHQEMLADAENAVATAQENLEKARRTYALCQAKHIVALADRDMLLTLFKALECCEWGMAALEGESKELK